jgi:hypothetical protein
MEIEPGAMEIGRPQGRWHQWRNPPVVTAARFGLLFGAVFLLDIGASTGTASSRAFVGGVPWLVWRIAAGSFIMLSAALFVIAVDTLRSGGAWGLTPSSERYRRYLGVATLAVIAFAIILVLFGRHTPSLPVRGQEVRTAATLFAGLAASIPWLGIVWLGAAECNSLEDRVLSLPEGGLLTARTPAEAQNYGNVIKQLLKLWRLLNNCALAFAVAVVAALVTTGALRAAFLSAHPALAKQFPPANVLFYGGFFALILLAITLPMATAWRDRARQVVDRGYPLPADGQPTESWIAARERLEHLLHLDVSVLRNPLTALSVFTPLVTAAVAAFVPQLGH